MRTIWGLILASGLLWTAVASAADAPGAEAVDRGFRETVRPFLETYCVGCHGAKQPKGELNLDAFQSAKAVAADLGRWELVEERSTWRSCRLERLRGIRRARPAQRCWGGLTRCGAGGESSRGRSGPGAGKTAEQRRVRQHDPGPDGCGPASDT